ncbi:MAG TPA: Asp23/Gls24 family envelope stress response protein [Candidatus Aerophobetes bacterium]|nr:Asp23/Gls24 family envelope stress response protein [Candidatus Aerophobetes bacterium]
MKEEKGYKVDKKVMIDFIKKSVEEVEGVFSIKGGLWGRKIRFKESDEGIEVFLGLVIRRGNSVPQVVEEIQRKLIREIEETFGISVKKVDVQIKGIESPK